MGNCTFYTEKITVANKTISVNKCHLLSVPHGFSMRDGGYSTLPHLSSLNLGYGIGDSDEMVDQNRSRFLTAALGSNHSHRDMIWANQIHSNTVAYVTEKDLGRDDFHLDGFVTDRPGVVLFVKTADCCPILFSDPIAGVIAAVHAGWRGSVSGIAANAVKEMCLHDARPDRIVCAIGPCIHECCFEVGEDFVSQVSSLLPSSLFHATVQIKENGRYHADLPAINHAILLDAGIKEENIAIAPSCTCCQPSVYFSHRATKGKRGLMGAVIML